MNNRGGKFRLWWQKWLLDGIRLLTDPSGSPSMVQRDMPKQKILSCLGCAKSPFRITASQILTVRWILHLVSSKAILEGTLWSCHLFTKPSSKWRCPN